MKKSKKMSKFIALGWTILEAKAVYYGYTNNLPILDDATYDSYEDEYRSLAEHLKLPTSAADAVGFPFDRPCAKLIISSLKKPRKKYTIEYYNKNT